MASAAGAQVILVSDDVVEAENCSRALFGFESTREISGQWAQEIVDIVRNWGQNDDITVVTVRRSAQCAIVWNRVCALHPHHRYLWDVQLIPCFESVPLDQ